MLIDSAINGMLAALDPHSAYLNPKNFRDMQVQTRGEFGGLGIEVTMENGVVKVVSPIDDTPAAKAGLQTNDLITHLDGEQIVGLTLEQAVEKMRGPVNTPITLTIVRKGRDDPFDVKIVRDVIRINAIKARAGRRRDLRQGLDLQRADARQPGEGGRRPEEDDGQEPQGLRDRSARQSRAGCSTRRSPSPTTSSRRARSCSPRAAAWRRRSAPTRGPATSPTASRSIVLINGGSASASEIVAGALQDHKRATVIGTRSFGKGSVQTIIPLGANGAIRLTTARYYTPSGRSIQAKGIDPDVVVEQELPPELQSQVAEPDAERGRACGATSRASPRTARRAPARPATCRRSRRRTRSCSTR